MSSLATFGKTDVGANNGGIGADQKNGCLYTLPVAGTVTKFSYYENAANCNVKFAIYDDGGGVPANAVLKGSTGAVACLSGQWNHSGAVAIALDAGDYYITLKTDNAGTRYRYDAGAVNQIIEKAEAYANAFSDPRS